MSVTSKPIIIAQYAEDSATTEYTTPSGVRTIIDKMSGYNGSGSTVTVTVRLVPSGESSGATNIVESATIADGSTWGFPHIVGHALEPGGIISVSASTADAVVIRATGREITS